MTPRPRSRPRLLILRLSPLRDVAHSATHHVLADAVRQALPDAAVELAFWPSGGTALRLEAFDLVLVSNSFLLEAVNLPYLLHRLGHAPWAAERPESLPPLILGGSNALASHGLVRSDGVAVPDAIFFGEGEGALPPFLTAWWARPELTKRARLLHAASQSEGFWVTGDWPRTPVTQAVARALPPWPLPLLLPESEAADTVRLQVSLGCAAFCSFCFEGYERKPYRERPAAWLLDYAKRLKAASGARAIELDAFNLNNHAELATLVTGLSRLYERIAFKSQRVDILAAQPALLALEIAAGKRAFTLGIEGISPRLRAFLQKSLADDAIAQVIRCLLQARVRELKLFFILTGHEHDDDLAAFERLTRDVAEWAGGRQRRTHIVWSFGYLVRMPRTPLRHDRLFLDPEPWRRLGARVAACCEAAGMDYRLAAAWPDYLATQLLAQADHRAAPLVVRLAQEGLHVDGPLPAAWATRLQRELADAGLLDAAALGEKPENHPFPYPFVASPVSAEFLFRQYQAARAAIDGDYCLGTACLACGACRDDTERDALTRRPRVPRVSAGAITTTARLVADKQRLAPLLAAVCLPPEFAGRRPEWVGARLMQRLLAAWPEEADNLLAVEEALFDAPANRERFPIPAGETLLALKAWHPERLARRLRRPAAASAAFIRPAPEGARAGCFRQTTWSLTAAGDARTLEAVLADWLRAAHLAFTLRREADGLLLEVTPAARRKQIVLEAACRPGAADSMRLILTLGPKADFFDLQRRLRLSTEGLDPPTCLAWTPALQ